MDHAFRHRHLQVPLPGLRRAGRVESGKEKLVCPFCGTESPYQIDRVTGQIQELDLVKTLRELPEDQRGWQAEKRSVQCQSCRAVMVFDPTRVGQNCEFCGSPALVDYQEIKAPIRPQSLLPFKVAQTARCASRFAGGTRASGWRRAS